MGSLFLWKWSAVNADGFSGSAIRNIMVIPPTGDLVNSIEGLYTAEVSRESESHTDLEYIMIKK